ncbi:hypothetical protein ACTXT7_007816 [Hymenolepis weldensis]
MFNFLTCVSPVLTLSRSVRVARYVRPYLRNLYDRRLVQGPEPYRPRSAWKPWNYDSEILAFKNRIGENIDTNVLHLCFIDKSFSSYTNSKDASGQLRDNSKLAEQGKTASDRYIRGFLRKFYPRLPEEWISCIRNHLLSDSELSRVGSHLGITDVLQYSLENKRFDDSPLLPVINQPPPNSAIATSFLALIGAIAKDQKAADLFIRDFILTRLLTLEFCSDFPFPLQDEPFKLLSGVLRFYKRGPPEPRLQKQSSMNTLLACYQVGIYSNCQLIGEAPGETIDVAEKEAALQALRNLFGIQDNRPWLPLSGKYVSVDDIPPNPTLEDYLRT